MFTVKYLRFLVVFFGLFFSNFSIDGHIEDPSRDDQHQKATRSIAIRHAIINSSQEKHSSPDDNNHKKSLGEDAPSQKYHVTITGPGIDRLKELVAVNKKRFDKTVDKATDSISNMQENLREFIDKFMPPHEPMLLTHGSCEEPTKERSLEKDDDLQPIKHNFIIEAITGWIIGSSATAVGAAAAGGTAVIATTGTAAIAGGTIVAGSAATVGLGAAVTGVTVGAFGAGAIATGSGIAIGTGIITTTAVATTATATGLSIGAIAVGAAAVTSGVVATGCAINAIQAANIATQPTTIIIAENAQTLAQQAAHDQINSQQNNNSPQNENDGNGNGSDNPNGNDDDKDKDNLSEKLKRAAKESDTIRNVGTAIGGIVTIAGLFENDPNSTQNNFNDAAVSVTPFENQPNTIQATVTNNGNGTLSVSSSKTNELPSQNVSPQAQNSSHHNDPAVSATIPDSTTNPGFGIPVSGPAPVIKPEPLPAPATTTNPWGTSLPDSHWPVGAQEKEQTEEEAEKDECEELKTMFAMLISTSNAPKQLQVLSIDIDCDDQTEKESKEDPKLAGNLLFNSIQSIMNAAFKLESTTMYQYFSDTPISDQKNNHNAKFDKFIRNGHRSHQENMSRIQQEKMLIGLARQIRNGLWENTTNFINQVGLSQDLIKEAPTMYHSTGSYLSDNDEIITLISKSGLQTQFIKTANVAMPFELRGSNMIPIANQADGFYVSNPMFDRVKTPLEKQIDSLPPLKQVHIEDLLNLKEILPFKPVYKANGEIVISK